MKPLSIIARNFACLYLLAGACAGQENAGGDPIAKYLAPPQLILEKAEELGLSPEQIMGIQRIVHQAELEIAGPASEMEPAYQALVEELAELPVDGAAALKKLGVYLDQEYAIKRRRVRMLIDVNGRLQPAQQQKLRSLKSDRSAEAAAVIEKRLQSKVEQLVAISKEHEARGEFPEGLQHAMKAFAAHMEKGEVEQAESLLDQTLNQFRGETKEAPTGAINVNPGAMKTEIEAMRVPDVAWRQIAWKTCLLEGLKASREQKKPLALWVFIDRPIDDKRC